MTNYKSTPDAYVLVAIDIVKHRHEILIAIPGKKRRRRITIQNTQEDYHRLISLLVDYGLPIRIGFEATGNYHRVLVLHLGCAGFELKLIYCSSDIRVVACMARIRRKFVDVHKAEGSAIAKEAIKRIAQLYTIEKEVRGSPPYQRAATRQAKAKPVFDDLARWLEAQLPNISSKSSLAGAIRYALTRLVRLKPYLDHGQLEIDNNAAERAIRGIALGARIICLLARGQAEKLLPLLIP